MHEWLRYIFVGLLLGSGVAVPMQLAAYFVRKKSAVPSTASWSVLDWLFFPAMGIWIAVCWGRGIHILWFALGAAALSFLVLLGEKEWVSLTKRPHQTKSAP